MPLQQKLALISAAPLNRTHTAGHLNCPACEDLRQKLAFGGDISAFLPFEEAAERWLELRELGGGVSRAQYVAPRTLRDDRQYLRRLARFFGRLRLDEIHPGHLREYQIERSHEAGSTKINQELSTLQRILRKGGLWSSEFEQGYQPLQAKASDVPRAMSPEEQRHWLEVAASCERWQLVYWYSIVALQTTASNTEMRHLRLGDVSMFQRVIKIDPAYAKNVYRAQTIDLSEEACWAMDRLLQRARALGSVEPHHYLFPFRVGPTRGTPPVR